MRFQFTRIYLPGTDNWFADALSRQHDDQDVMVGGKDDNVNIQIISLNTEETLAMAAEKKGKKTPDKHRQSVLIAQTHALGHFGTETMCRKL